MIVGNLSQSQVKTIRASLPPFPIEIKLRIHIFGKFFKNYGLFQNTFAQSCKKKTFSLLFRSAPNLLYRNQQSKTAK